MPESGTVTCRSCGKQDQRPGLGWYSVSVGVPLWFNATTRKPYRWIGIFCSVDCLIAHQDTMRRDEALMAEVYRRAE